MKKTYIKPQTTAMQVESEMPMAASSLKVKEGYATGNAALVNEMEFNDIWGN